MDYYHLYKDAGGHWRWRYYSSNGRIIADSGEGYFNRQDALTGIAIMKRSANAPVKET